MNLNFNHLQEELESLENAKHQWVLKRNTFRAQEPRLSDISMLHTLRIDIEDANNKIEEIDREISRVMNQINLLSKDSRSININKIDENSTSEDIASALEVFNQHMKTISSFNSTKEDYVKMIDLQVKIQEGLFKNSNTQLDFITLNSEKKALYSSALFDRIYTSEIIDPLVESEIQKFREDNKRYKWYDRSIIVSALTLSLVNFKFNIKKANMLLDFILDFESNVWERALTGLTISILYHREGGWTRNTSFMNRLRMLQNIPELQDGIKAIDFILKNEIYKLNFYSERIFEMDLFREPMNCFMPFYEHNDILEKALSNSDSSVDAVEFQEFMDSVPLLDSHKYAVSMMISEGKLKSSNGDKKSVVKTMKSLRISRIFYPFQNLISEYFLFFKYFPEKKVDNLFKKMQSLTDTKLKTVVLNRIMLLQIDATSLRNDGNYTQAIAKCKDLLRIDKKNIPGRILLACCYQKAEDYKNALAIYLILERELLEDKVIEILYDIAFCYNKQKKYDLSNEYLTKLESKTKNHSYRLLSLKAENYFFLLDNLNAYLYCQKSEDKIFDEDDMADIAQNYYLIEKYDHALKFINMAIETQPNNALYLNMLGKIYCENFEWDLSIQLLESASTRFDNNNDKVKLNLARTYLFSKYDVMKAEKIFMRLLKSKKQSKDIINGNLGHLYFINGNNELAFQKYLQCLKLLKDVNEFDRKMNADLKFFVNLGILEKDYNEMKNKVVSSYVSSVAK